MTPRKKLPSGPALRKGFRFLRAKHPDLPAKMLIFRIIKADDITLSCDLICCITKEFPYIHLWRIPVMVQLYISENSDKIAV